MWRGHSTRWLCQGYELFISLLIGQRNRIYRLPLLWNFLFDISSLIDTKKNCSPMGNFGTFKNWIHNLFLCFYLFFSSSQTTVHFSWGVLALSPPMNLPKYEVAPWHFLSQETEKVPNKCTILEWIEHLAIKV